MTSDQVVDGVVGAGVSGQLCQGACIEQGGGVEARGAGAGPQDTTAPAVGYFPVSDATMKSLTLGWLEERGIKNTWCVYCGKFYSEMDIPLVERHLQHPIGIPDHPVGMGVVSEYDDVWQKHIDGIDFSKIHDDGCACEMCFKQRMTHRCALCGQALPKMNPDLMKPPEVNEITKRNLELVVPKGFTSDGATMSCPKPTKKQMESLAETIRELWTPDHILAIYKPLPKWLKRVICMVAPDNRFLRWGWNLIKVWWKWRVRRVNKKHGFATEQGGSDER